jgi:hypothetical protein
MEKKETIKSVKIFFMTQHLKVNKYRFACTISKPVPACQKAGVTKC